MITEGEYSTFVSYDAYISNGPFALSEGYGPKDKYGNVTGDTHNILIRGSDTHFAALSTQFKVRDKNNQIVEGAGTFADVESSSMAYISIRTSGNGVLTAAGSPYTIEIITPNVYEEFDGSLQDEVMHTQIFVGLPVYLAAGEYGNVYTSCDPAFWKGDSSFPSSVSTHIYASEYRNGMYLIGGQYGEIYYRSENETWTKSSTPGISQTIRDITYSDALNLYIAVGDSGRIASSSTGRSWTAVSSGTTNNLSGVAYGNGYFIAIGQSGITLLSADGTTWTKGPVINYGMDLSDITFKYNKFIVVGQPIRTGPVSNQYIYNSYLYHTDTGAGWTEVQVFEQRIRESDNQNNAVKLESIGWDDSYFIIGTDKGSFYYSDDLKENQWWFFTLDWSVCNVSVLSTPIRDIAWMDGCFFAVSDNGKLLYSYTGISNWNILTLGSKNLHTVSTR